MKLTEEKIKQKYREQEKKKSIRLKHLNNIKNVQSNISNIHQAKTLEFEKKSKKLNEIKHLKENFNEGLLYIIIKTITFGLVDQKKIHLNKIEDIHSILYDIDSKIIDLENKIIVEENNITIEENNITIINKNIVTLSNEIKDLENEFLNKLFKFRGKLIEVQSKIVKYSNIRYIDNLKRIEFKTFVDNSIAENKKYILHEKIKSSLIEIIDFNNNTSSWTKKKNKLFISNEKKKEKRFFDTIESNPLTVKQTEAVLINEQHNLILAGAGSGKTSVVVAKVCYMLNKNIVKENEILILAFNKKAQ
ncbi:MAG: UvrD-helicase domain-containing protein, partial [Campylobacterota bacterium]|nr:UvrD-helicase domain-containing protein [Campylobacterota bacterium]